MYACVGVPWLSVLNKYVGFLFDKYQFTKMTVPCTVSRKPEDEAIASLPPCTKKNSSSRKNAMTIAQMKIKFPGTGTMVASLLAMDIVAHAQNARAETLRTQ